MSIQTIWASEAIRLATEAGGSGQPGKRTGPVSKDTVPRILHGLDCGRILKTVERLPEPQQSWVLVAYASPGWVTLRRRMRVQAALISEFWRTRKSRNPGRVTNLAVVAMEDMQVRGRGGKPLKPGDICARADIDVRKYTQDWNAHYQALLDILGRWNAAGLGPVREELTAMVAARVAERVHEALCRRPGRTAGELARSLGLDPLDVEESLEAMAQPGRRGRRALRVVPAGERVCRVEEERRFTWRAVPIEKSALA